MFLKQSITIFPFRFNHGKKLIISEFIVCYRVLNTGFGKHARSSDIVFRFAVNFRHREFQSTFDTKSFSQILTV